MEYSKKANKSHAILKVGFSLAEVLLALTIIGVIAAMTIPTLVTNIQERIIITRLQKVYVELDKAYQAAVLTYGKPSRWGFTTNSTADKDTGNHNLEDVFWERMLPFMKYVSYDPSANQALEGKKWNIYHLWDKTLAPNRFLPSVQMEDGVYFTPFWTHSFNCKSGNFSNETNACGTFAVDLNGISGPNVEGRDVFHFILTQDGIVPTGDRKAENKELNFKEYCVKPDKKPQGRGCAAWVIYNSNMDYLRCGCKLNENNEEECLGWDEKLKCD